MTDYHLVARQFVEHYYNTFDTHRANLHELYREHSMLTFEDSAIQGTASIVEKLTSLNFQKVQHQLATLDSQPASEHGNILVLVTGALLVDEEQKPMNFVQTFQLCRDAGGAWFVLNDIFKLVYG